MKRSDSVFALLLCLAIIYYAATGWGDQVIFPAGSGGTVRESGENEISAVPLGNGKKYSAEFMQEERHIR